MVDVNKCRMTRYPAKVLAKPAKPVEHIDEDVRLLVQKMADIMFKHKGIGLAAPQAGINLRLFIISLDGNPENVRVYINPTVTPDGELDTAEEGCLSIPGIYTNIKRYKKATVTATDIDGNKFTEQAEGLYARCLQHEYDHIQGITIADRMGTAAKIAHRKTLKRLAESGEEK